MAQEEFDLGLDRSAPGRFVGEDGLGRGFTGVVIATFDTRRRCKVAIKVLSKPMYLQHGLEYPPLEARLNFLNHPNIVKVLEVLDDPQNERILVIQECLLGGDLFTCMQQAGIFPELLARCCFIDLLRGVEYLHNQGIVHRDLKSENCVLDELGTLKIIDFGLASYYTPGVLFHDFCGSPEYAAPEIHRGCPYEGPPADVWAMGVILYDMVVGDIPFSAGEDYSLPAIALETLSMELYQLVTICLCENPRERASVAFAKQCDWMNLPIRAVGSSDVEIVSSSSVSSSVSSSSSPSISTIDNASPLHLRLAVERQKALQTEMGFDAMAQALPPPPRRSLFKSISTLWKKNNDM